MALNRKRLVYFERWFDPVAERVLNAEDDIELTREQWYKILLAARGSPLP